MMTKATTSKHFIRPFGSIELLPIMFKTREELTADKAN